MSKMDIVDYGLVQELTTLSPREVAGRLEDLHHEDVRRYFVASGLINAESGLIIDRQRLCQLIEASFTWRGDGEHSSLLEALDPSHVAVIVVGSSAIVSCEHFDLIHPADYNDSESWLPITEQQYEIILESNDQSLIRRTAVFRSLYGVNRWYFYRDDLVIVPESVLSYFSAICNADRSDEWKEESLRAVGLDLLAVASRKYEEIYWDCLRWFPDIADEIKERSERPQTIHDALEPHRVVLESLQRELKDDIDLDDRSLRRVMRDLRDIGIPDPTAIEVKEYVDMNTKLVSALTQGVNGIKKGEEEEGGKD